MEPNTVLESLCDRACTELFSTLQVSLAPATPREGAADQIAAVLGFAGDDLRGSLGVVADLGLLQESRARLLGGEGTEDGLEDWAGEIANQVLGRVKNELLGYDQAISLATPMVLRGLRLALAGSARPVVRLAWTTPAGSLWVWMDVRHRPGLTLREGAAPSAGFDEGEMVMF